MFAEAPIDSDVFISYIHHNFPAFTESDDIEQCQNIVENFSVADSLMRMEGDEASSNHFLSIPEMKLIRFLL